MSCDRFSTGVPSSDQRKTLPRIDARATATTDLVVAAELAELSGAVGAAAVGGAGLGVGDGVGDGVGVIVVGGQATGRVHVRKQTNCP